MTRNQRRRLNRQKKEDSWNSVTSSEKKWAYDTVDGLQRHKSTTDQEHQANVLAAKAAQVERDKERENFIR